MAQVDSNTKRGFAPSLARPIVERPRLMRLLDCSTARIRLLIAPAGYGKTTLADQWLARRPHAWYSCSAGSSDVADLAHGLAELIFEVLPELERTLRMHLKVAAQAREQTEHFTEVIVEHLENWPPDLILAIDDYQLIAQSRDAEYLFDAIVEQTRVPLLITTRNRPAWASARHLLYGDVYEIDQKALSMTRAEAAGLLTNKPPAVSRELIAMARGWPAILALAWHADPRILPRRSSALPEQLYQYIAEEIYAAASEETRKVLPLLALVRHADRTLLEDALDASTLASFTAEAVGLGLLPSRTSHRLLLHPLLSSFLTASIPLSAIDQDIAARLTHALLTRARWDDAFSVARGCSSLHLLDLTMEAALQPLLDAGRIETIRKWLNATSALGGESPIRYLAQAEIARRNADFAKAESLALHAARGFPHQHALSCLALIVAGSVAHLTHRDSVALEHYDRAERLIRSPRDSEELLWGNLVAASALEQPSMFVYGDALRSMADPRSAATQLRLAAGAYVSGRASGSLSAALAESELAAPLVTECSDPMITSMFLHGHAYMLALAARYDEALEVVHEALSYSARFRLRFVKSHVLPTLAIALIGVRQFREADRALEQALAVATDLGSRRYVEMNSRIIRARGCLAQHEFDEAQLLTVPYGGGVPERALYAELLATHALSCLGCGQSETARRYSSKAVAVSNGVEAACANALVQTLATFIDQVDCPTTGRPAVLEAIARGGADVLVASYRAFPAWAAQVLSGDCREALAEVMSAARDDEIAKQSGVHLSRPTPKSSVERLTRREREVADLLIEGLSNAEIASKLVVTESTVKVHLRSIFRKLGVRRRTEAVIKLLRQPG